MTYNYKIDRERLEAILDARNAAHAIKPPVKKLSDALPDLSAPQICNLVPNQHMLGFNAGREMRRMIGEVDIANVD